MTPEGNTHRKVPVTLFWHVWKTWNGWEQIRRTARGGQKKTKRRSCGKEEGAIGNSRSRQVKIVQVNEGNTSDIEAVTVSAKHKDTQKQVTDQWRIRGQKRTAFSQWAEKTFWLVSVYCRCDLSKQQEIKMKLPSAQNRYSMWVFWLQTSILYNLGMWHINNSCLTDFKHFTNHSFFTVSMICKISFQW